MKKVKLSELADDIEISIEESNTFYTVAELKREIIKLGKPHHESTNWYTIKMQRWSPDAKGDYATVYWTYEIPVEIDVFPEKRVTSHSDDKAN